MKDQAKMWLKSLRSIWFKTTSEYLHQIMLRNELKMNLMTGDEALSNAECQVSENMITPGTSRTLSSHLSVTRALYYGYLLGSAVYYSLSILMTQCTTKKTAIAIVAKNSNETDQQCSHFEMNHAMVSTIVTGRVESLEKLQTTTMSDKQLQLCLRLMGIIGANLCLIVLYLDYIIWVMPNQKVWSLVFDMMSVLWRTSLPWKLANKISSILNGGLAELSFNLSGDNLAQAISGKAQLQAAWLNLFLQTSFLLLQLIIGKQCFVKRRSGRKKRYHVRVPHVPGTLSPKPTDPQCPVEPSISASPKN